MQRAALDTTVVVPIDNVGGVVDVTVHAVAIRGLRAVFQRTGFQPAEDPVERFLLCVLAQEYQPEIPCGVSVRAV